MRNKNFSRRVFKTRHNRKDSVMRIGITGGTGFIGQYIIRDYGEKIDFVAPVIESPKNVNYAKYYFSNYSIESLCEIFDGCDAVIHLAAKVWKKNNEQVLMNDYIDNTVLSANVFEACRINNIKNVVHASSRAVYDWEGDVKGLIGEDANLRPKNAYGVSKVCDEILASYYNDVYDMKILSYRFPEVCGFDLAQGLIHPFWNRVLKCCIDKKPIPLWGGGYACRDLLYVKDAAEAIIFGIRNNKNGGVFNICSGRKTSNRELVEAFCRAFKNTGGIEVQQDKEEWGVRCVLDPEKELNELGFNIRYNTDELVKDIKIEYEKCLMQFKE